MHQESLYPGMSPLVQNHDVADKPASHSKQVSAGRILLVIFLLAAGTEFIFRGPVRGIETSTTLNDFISPYVQAKALVEGRDPYSPDTLIQLWPASVGHFNFLAREKAEGVLTVRRGIPTAYPLNCLFLLSIFDLFPWPVANLLWVSLNVALFFCMLVCLVSLAKLPWRSWRTHLLLALSLAFAPFQTGIGTGNPAILSVELAMIAMWAAQRQHNVEAGALLAIAISLKPQLALPLLLCYVLQRRWRLCLVSIGLVASFLAISVVRLGIAGTPWVQSYRTDSYILLKSGVLSDFTERNPLRFGLINAHVLFYALTENREVAGILSLLLGAALFVCWLYFAWRRKSVADVLAAGTLLTISLLPAYHRFYDAAVLILPLWWAVTAVTSQANKRIAIGVLTCLVPFFVPGGSFLETMLAQNRIPGNVIHTLWWNVIVMPHQIWALVVMSALLLGAMGSTPEEHLRSPHSEQHAAI